MTSYYHTALITQKRPWFFLSKKPSWDDIRHDSREIHIRPAIEAVLLFHAIGPLEIYPCTIVSPKQK